MHNAQARVRRKLASKLIVDLETGDTVKETLWLSEYKEPTYSQHTAPRYTLSSTISEPVQIQGVFGSPSKHEVFYELHSRGFWSPSAGKSVEIKSAENWIFGYLELCIEELPQVVNADRLGSPWYENRSYSKFKISETGLRSDYKISLPQGEFALVPILREGKALDFGPQQDQTAGWMLSPLSIADTKSDLVLEIQVAGDNQDFKMSLFSVKIGYNNVLVSRHEIWSKNLRMVEYRYVPSSCPDTEIKLSEFLRWLKAECFVGMRSAAIQAQVAKDQIVDNLSNLLSKSFKQLRATAKDTPIENTTPQSKVTWGDKSKMIDKNLNGLVEHFKIQTDLAHALESEAVQVVFQRKQKKGSHEHSVIEVDEILAGGSKRKKWRIRYDSEVQSEPMCLTDALIRLEKENLSNLAIIVSPKVRPELFPIYRSFLSALMIGEPTSMIRLMNQRSETLLSWNAHSFNRKRLVT
jgi:hypothetical protein